MNFKQKNHEDDIPFPGPTPFSTSQSHLLYGRDDDAKLIASIMDEDNCRVLLLYSQSGAGKTSLLNTKIKECLELDGKEVITNGRVGVDLESNSSGNYQAEDNIFYNSLIKSLNEKSLDNYLITSIDEKIKEYQKPVVVIIDQIEELFIKHYDHFLNETSRNTSRKEFISKLSSILDIYDNLQIIFAVRKEYFVDTVSIIRSEINETTSFRVYELTKLNIKGVIEAIKKPFQIKNKKIHENEIRIIVKLVMYGDFQSYDSSKDDNDFDIYDEWIELKGKLSASDESKKGHQDLVNKKEEILSQPLEIELVYLQVICNLFWRENRVKENGIKFKDFIEKFKGSFLEILRFFYVEVINKATRYFVDIITDSKTADKNIKENVELLIKLGCIQFITRHSTGYIRNMIPKDSLYVGRLNIRVCEYLEKENLLRSELRGGTRHYELSHDQLVPIIVDELKNLSFQDVLLASELIRLELENIHSSYGNRLTGYFTENHDFLQKCNYYKRFDLLFFDNKQKTNIFTLLNEIEAEFIYRTCIATGEDIKYWSEIFLLKFPNMCIDVIIENLLIDIFLKLDKKNNAYKNLEGDNKSLIHLLNYLSDKEFIKKVKTIKLNRFFIYKKTKEYLLNLIIDGENNIRELKDLNIIKLNEYKSKAKGNDEKYSELHKLKEYLNVCEYECKTIKNLINKSDGNDEIIEDLILYGIVQLTLNSEKSHIRKCSAITLAKLNNSNVNKKIISNLDSENLNSKSIESIVRICITEDMMPIKNTSASMMQSIEEENRKLKLKIIRKKWITRFQEGTSVFIYFFFPAIILGALSAGLFKAIPGHWNWALCQASPSFMMGAFHGATAGVIWPGMIILGITCYYTVFSRRWFKCNYSRILPQRPFGAVILASLFGMIGSVIVNMIIIGVYQIQSLELMGWIYHTGYTSENRLFNFEFWQNIFVEIRYGWVYILLGGGMGAGMALTVNSLRSSADWEHFIQQQKEAVEITGKEIDRISKIFWEIIKLVFKNSCYLPLCIFIAGLMSLPVVNFEDNKHKFIKKEDLKIQPNGGELTKVINNKINEKLNNKLEKHLYDKSEVIHKATTNDLIKGMIGDGLSQMIGGFFGICGMIFGCVLMIRGITLKSQETPPL